MSRSDDWTSAPPEELTPTMRAWVTTRGSLTELLAATGRRFAVDLTRLGDTPASSDEGASLGLSMPATVTARDVVLTLDGEPVIVARSYCHRASPTWLPVLDRGGRSLGLTLFSGEVTVRRGPIEFRLVSAGHAVFDLVRQCDGSAPGYPARRNRFVLDDAPLVVCEAFLPALERVVFPGHAW